MDEIMRAYEDDIRNVAESDLPWDKFEGRNILIVGATGLIGFCIVEILMARQTGNYEVFAAGRNEERGRELSTRYCSDKRFHFIRMDVTEPVKGDIAFHYVIDAASGANPKLYASDPIGVIRANINGTDNLLAYGVRHGMEKFLYVSSGEVYGEGDGRKFTEDYSGYVDCTSVRACYPSSKRAAETLCMAYSYQHGLNVSIARPSHVYGPTFTNGDSRAYAQFIRNVLQGEDIMLKSDGSQYRSWCYSADCASALLHILLKGENGRAYNVADDSSNITIREFAELTAEICNRKVVFRLPEKMEKQGFSVVTKAVFDTSALEEIGWKPLTGTIKDKIGRTVLSLLSRR